MSKIPKSIYYFLVNKKYIDICMHLHARAILINNLTDNISQTCWKFSYPNCEFSITFWSILFLWLYESQIQIECNLEYKIYCS